MERPNLPEKYMKEFLNVLLAPTYYYESDEWEVNEYISVSIPSLSILVDCYDGKCVDISGMFSSLDVSASSDFKRVQR